jgi:uncharacterized protein YjeT (DUF2065 family)
MLKLIFLGLGFILVFEGLLYFVFAKRMKAMFEIIKTYDPDKIRFFSSILIIIGLFVIYFTLKIHKI